MKVFSTSNDSTDYSVDTMFVDSSRVRSSNGKTYTRHLLGSSFRENGKVRHRTLGNLSSCSDQQPGRRAQLPGRLRLQPRRQARKKQTVVGLLCDEDGIPPANGTVQMDLFEDELAEVFATAENSITGKAERYILRRNPVRQREMMASRMDKKATLEREVAGLNDYLAAHTRAKPETARQRLEKRLVKLGLGNWLAARADGRVLALEEDEAALAQESKLDGCYLIRCYLIRTDLEAGVADKHLVHERYKSLAQVEQAFRRSKTVELEMRPVHVRKESSTRGHLMVVMLAYLLMRELGRRWARLDITVAEGLARLNTYCAVEVAGAFEMLLEPRADVSCPALSFAFRVKSGPPSSFF